MLRIFISIINVSFKNERLSFQRIIMLRRINLEYINQINIKTRS